MNPDPKENRAWFTKKLFRGWRLAVVPHVPATILCIFILVALFAPQLSPYSPTEAHFLDKLMPPAWVEGGSSEYILGTDFMGRDVLSRLIHGSRVSMTVGMLVIVVAGSLGTVIGVISGYFGGWIDILLMRFTDITLSIPAILMAIILVALFGASYFNIILVIVLLLWPRYARQIRGDVLNVKEQEFVALADVAGCSHIRIMWQHILPNVLPTILVLATLQVGWVIILESSLSFLGVGIPPPQPAWGVMVAEARGLVSSAWWIALFPGLAILFNVLSLNILGDWLRDRLDPKLRSI